MLSLSSQTNPFQALKSKNTLIPKSSRLGIKSKKVKFGIKLNINCGSGTNLDMQMKLIIFADQCINRSNLKINLLDVVIIDDSDDLDLDYVLIPFYQRLKRQGTFLEYLKLNLGSLALYNKAISNHNLQIVNAVKSPFCKLSNLKALNLDIWIVNYLGLEQSRGFNQLIKSITTYLKDLQSLKLNIVGGTFGGESRFKLKSNWNYIKKLENLQNFTLELKGEDIICSKPNIIKLLTILKENTKLKKFHIAFNSNDSSIDLSPFQNLSEYFMKLNALESLKLNLPINERYHNISYELIKVLQDYPNLKEIYLICGDKSHGFRDRIPEIIECLGNLTQLENTTIKFTFESQANLLQLANRITRMKKLKRLKLTLEYTGEQLNIFNDFMTSFKLSMDSLNHLLLRIKSNNSTISNEFWESFAESLYNPTLESFDLFIVVARINMNNHDMETFALKLCQNINLSKLRLSLHAHHKFDGAGLIHIAKILKYLKYIDQLRLDYQNVDYMNADYFYIMQNSLKDKYISMLRICINYELKRFIFPSNTLNDIIKLLAYTNNHKIIDEVYLAIPIHKSIQSQKIKLLNIIKRRQIPKLKIELEEYSRISTRIYHRYIIRSTLYTPKLNYELQKKNCYILYGESEDDNFVDTCFAEKLFSIWYDI